MADRIKTDIRFYLASDPYYFGVDNLPIRDLASNDQILQFQIDQLQAKFEGLTGRDTFNDLKPYVDETEPGKVFVKPGSFIGRVNIPSDRYTGLEGRLDDGENTAQSVIAQPETETNNLQNKVKGIARTAFIRLLKTDGVDPNVAIPSFTEEDYPNASSTNNQAPAYRLDLIYAEAYPSEDIDNGKPRLGVIAGGYFLEAPSGVSSERKAGNRFTDTSKLNGRAIQMESEDIEIGIVIEEKKNSTERVKYTTVPVPDDMRNFIYRPQDLVNVATGLDLDSDIPTEEQLQAWAESQFDNRGTFCLPICYVLVPFGYLNGNFLSTENLIDIRPFFRTAELTLDERQAVAGSYRPSLKNRFITRKDPDYEDLRNTWVRGDLLSVPGNHEGRIKDLDNRIYRLPSIYFYDTLGKTVLLDDEYGGDRDNFIFYGTATAAPVITVPFTDMPSIFNPDLAKGLIIRFDIFTDDNMRVRAFGTIRGGNTGLGNQVFYVGNYADGSDTNTYDTVVAYIPIETTYSEIKFQMHFQTEGASNDCNVRALIIGHFN